MIDYSEWIKAADLTIKIQTKRLIEDIACYNTLPEEGSVDLSMALHFRMAVLFSLLEITTIEKAMLGTAHPFAKRYHYKNLIANTSECYKLLYHFGNARKKSIWMKISKLLQQINDSELLAQYNTLTTQLNDFGENKIDKTLRDVTMHYSESMLTVYELTTNLKSEEDAVNYYLEFSAILLDMLKIANQLVDFYAQHDTSGGAEIPISTNLIGDEKLNMVKSIVDAQQTLSQTIDTVLPKGTQDLDYFADTEKRVGKIKDFTLKHIPFDDVSFEEFDFIIQLSEVQTLLRFMMLDMAVNLEAFCHSTSTMEAALNIRRFIIPQVSTITLLYGYSQDELNASIWHFVAPIVPDCLSHEKETLNNIFPKLCELVKKDLRNSYVHVYDDKGNNLIPTFIDSMNNMNFLEELNRVLKMTQFYGIFSLFTTNILDELAKIAHAKQEESSQKLDDMIEQSTIKVEQSALPSEIKEQILARISWIKKMINKV